MNTLDAEGAARLLHVTVKRVQALARQGRLPSARVGRKWLFRREDIEALLGGRAPVAPVKSFVISARNRLRGEVAGMVSGRPSRRADTGATAVEYCLLATFIAVAVVGTVTLLGTQLVGLFSAVFPAL